MKQQQVSLIKHKHAQRPAEQGRLDQALPKGLRYSAGRGHHKLTSSSVGISLDCAGSLACPN